MSGARVRFAAVPYGPVLDPEHRARLSRREQASLGGRAAARAAGLVAVKTAAMNVAAEAGGLDPFGWTDAEVVRREGAAPWLYVRGVRWPGELSLSHEGGLAVAAVGLDAPEAPCGR